MKKKLLVGLFMMLASASFAQFTPGNLAIYRYGNGTDALANGVRVPVYVDQYTPAGVFVNTIAISQTASGLNYGLEGLGLTGGGAYEAEGYPVLSDDGTTLSVMGYNPAVTGQFVIGTINGAGSVSTTTLVIDDIGAPRSAVVNGANVYFNGYQNGVRYKALGTTTASTRVSTNQNAPRVLTIAGTSLGATPTVSVKLFAPESITSIPMTDLPTTSTTLSTLAFSGSSPVNAHQVIAFKSLATPARTLLYVLDDNGGSPLIRKYRSNAGGDTWIAFGTLGVPVGTKSLTGTITAAGVKLYYVSLGVPGSSASTLYTYNDAFTAANEASTNLSGTSAAAILTAPANTIFRGVTMAPVSNVLPVDLISFEGKEVSKSIQLNWATASETNSSHFEISKSFNGENFVKIAEVQASNNTNNKTTYSFVDDNPYAGVNYYQLKQMDKNGTSKIYSPIAVTSKTEKNSFNVFAFSANSTADFFIYSTNKQLGKVKIVDLAGKIVAEQTLDLDKGFSKISVPVKQSNGLQVAVLTLSNQKIVQKFIWQ